MQRCLLPRRSLCDCIPGRCGFLVQSGKAGVLRHPPSRRHPIQLVADHFDPKATGQISMISTRSSNSAHITFRLLVTFALWLTGLSLAGTALASWQGLAIALRSSSQKQISSEAVMIVKSHVSGASKKRVVPARSIAGKTNAPGAPRASGPAGWPPFNGAQPTVTTLTISTEQAGLAEDRIRALLPFTRSLLPTLISRRR